jgi:hypothetical protein
VRVGLLLGVAGVAAAITAVGIDLHLFDRYSTYVTSGDLVALTPR